MRRCVAAGAKTRRSQNGGQESAAVDPFPFVPAMRTDSKAPLWASKGLGELVDILRART